MGLLRDRESELSDLQRLVARLKEPSRRPELNAAEWPLAMVAYALERSEEPELLGSEGQEAYAAFVEHAPQAARQSSLTQLAQFVASRKGAAWKALLLYVIGEAQDEKLCMQAATHALTLAPAGEEARFAGAAALTELLTKDAPPAALSALLGISDLRLLPLLEPLYSLPQARLETLLNGLRCTLNSLSAAWLLRLLDEQPALAEPIVAALKRMAACTPLVADIVYPIPTWAYRQPAPQPLHAWTPAEYLPRMLPRLESHLSAEQLRALESSFR